MHSTQHHTRAATVAALAIAVAATACSRSTHPAGTPAAPAQVTSEQAPTIVVAIPEPPIDDPLDLGTVDVDLGLDKPIDRLPFDANTDGTGPQIALRFLRALQRHDDIAAARTLTDIARLAASLHGEAHLHRVLADVAARAHLATAGRCTSARRVNPDAAVVTCGARRIVVHVSDGFGAGIQLAPWHPRGDVYRGPHTHAYSDIDL
jgi:hypothetical protein